MYCSLALSTFTGCIHHYQLFPEFFHFPKLKPYLLNIDFPFFLHAQVHWQPLFHYCVSINLTTLGTYIGESHSIYPFVTDLFCSAYLQGFTMLYEVSKFPPFFFFKAEWCPFLCIHHTLFIFQWTLGFLLLVFGVWRTRVGSPGRAWHTEGNVRLSEFLSYFPGTWAQEVKEAATTLRRKPGKFKAKSA